jgi:hypothetical protein
MGAKKWVIGIFVTVLFLPVIAIMWLFSGSGMCGEGQEVVASSTLYEIIWHHSDCGATTDYNTTVYFKDTRTGEEQVLLEGYGRPTLDINWRDDQVNIKLEKIRELYDITDMVQMQDGYSVSVTDVRESDNVRIMNKDKTWTLGQSKQGDTNLIVRYDTELKSKVNTADYPIRMGVAVPITLNEGNHEILANLEDKIIKLLGNDGVIYVVLSASDLSLNEFIQTNALGNFKEYVFYVKRGYDFETLHNTLKQEFPELDVQMYAEEDLSWAGYEEFAHLRK